MKHTYNAPLAGKRRNSMKELDVVKLLYDYEGVPKGTKGTIVSDYKKGVFEVEFMDLDGNTIDVVTTPKDALEVVCEYHKNSAGIE